MKRSLKKALIAFLLAGLLFPCEAALSLPNSAANWNSERIYWAFQRAWVKHGWDVAPYGPTKGEWWFKRDGKWCRFI